MVLRSMMKRDSSNSSSFKKAQVLLSASVKILWVGVVDEVGVPLKECI